MLALVVIPANALFLDAYGAKWLPATYIAIAVFGTGASALVARAARRTQARSCRDGQPLHRRRPLRRVVADPRGRRSLGLRGAPGAVPDRAPDGIRVHRRPGGPTPGCAADEGAVSAGRGRILGRVPPRRPPRHPTPRPARIDREPAARRDGRTARVPRPPARDGAEVSGSPFGSGRGLARSGPSVGTDAVRVGPRSPPPRLPVAVGHGLVAASTSSSSTVRMRTTAATT